MYLLQKICEDIDDILLGWPSGWIHFFFRHLARLNVLFVFACPGKEKRSQKQPAATKPCDQTRAPMRTNYTEQLIDDSVWQCPQCTLINEDPLCAACGYFIADMQSSQNVDQDGMAGMAAWLHSLRVSWEIGLCHWVHTWFQKNPGLRPWVTEAAESAEYRLEAEIETKFSCWLRENGLEAKGVLVRMLFQLCWKIRNESWQCQAKSIGVL